MDAPVPSLTPPHAAAMARPTWRLAATPTDEAQSVSVSGDTVWELTQDAPPSLSDLSWEPTCAHRVPETVASRHGEMRRLHPCDLNGLTGIAP